MKKLIIITMVFASSLAFAKSNPGINANVKSVFQNLIANGEFDHETPDAFWGGWINGGETSVNVAVDTTSKLSGKNSYRLAITNASTTTYFIQRNIDCPIELGHQYQVSFQAVAYDAAGDSSKINVLLEENGGAYSKRMDKTAVVESVPKVFTYLVDYCPATDPGNQLKLHFGGTYNDGDTIWVDAITVLDLGPSMSILVDGQKDPFYETLVGPNDGFIQLKSFTYTQAANGRIPTGDDDLSSKIYAAWDDEWFYLYNEVTDDSVAAGGAQVYHNDEIEIKIDPVPSDSTQTSNFEMRLTALDSANVLTGQKTDNMITVPDSMKQIVRRMTDTGYVLEIAVKWAAITIGGEVITPAVDAIFGATLQNHDNDGTNTRHASVQWGAVLSDDAYKIAKYLGTVKLLADNKVQFIAQNAMTGVVNPVPYDGTTFYLRTDGYRDPFYQSLTGPDDGHLQLKSYAFNNNGVPAGDADLSAKIWTAWDDTWFYLYEEVKDDTISMSNVNSYNNDGFEIKIDPVATDSVVNSIYSTVQMTVKDTTAAAGGTNGAADSLMVRSRRITADGYAIEFAVKWSAIKGGTALETVPVGVGNVFGAALQNHDNDNIATTGTRTASVQWAAELRDQVWNQPKYLGTVKFLADHKLQFIPTNNITGRTNDIPYDGTPFYMRIDGLKDPFYYSLTGPADGYLQLRSYAYNNNGKPNDDADLSAKIWTAWDDTWFYLYEEVKDDTISMSNVNSYNNDGFEMKIDPQPTDSVKNSINATIGMTAKDTTAAAGGASILADSLGLSKKYRKLVTGGYVIEFAVKWDTLKAGTPLESIDVGVDNIFGAALQNHDNDNIATTGTRSASVQWAAVLRDQVWNQPKYLGTVKFLADNKLQYVAQNNMTGVATIIPYDGSDFVGVEETDQVQTPMEFSLKQNYPNPFNPTTTISFSVPKASHVRLSVFDIIGREVAVLVDEQMKPGFYKAVFDGKQMASGIYFYRMEADSKVMKQKMVMIK